MELFVSNGVAVGDMGEGPRTRILYGPVQSRASLVSAGEAPGRQEERYATVDALL